MGNSMKTYKEFVVFVDSLLLCLPGYIDHVRAQKPITHKLREMCSIVNDLDIMSDYNIVVGYPVLSLTCNETLLKKCHEVEDLKTNLFFCIRIVNLIPLEERGKTKF